MSLSATLSIKDAQHNSTLSVVMLSVVMLNIVTLLLGGRVT